MATEHAEKAGDTTEEHWQYYAVHISRNLKDGK